MPAATRTAGIFAYFTLASDCAMICGAVKFMPHGGNYRHPPKEMQAEIAAAAGISSLQITFHEDWSADRHAMPPGGFRVAIVNCWDRAAGNAARDRLRSYFST